MPHPFVASWDSQSRISDLLSALPSVPEAYLYFDSFQNQAQASISPGIPVEFNQADLDQFLADSERNALLRPDILALVCAMLAQGIQHGVYYRCNRRWVAGAMECDLRKGDALSKSYGFRLHAR